MNTLRFKRSYSGANLAHSPHREKRLSLSKQTELVSDALLISNVSRIV